MVRMLFMCNEEKIVEDKMFSVENINEEIDGILKKHNIENKDEKGIWVGNNDEKDLSRFMSAISALGKCEWCEKYVNNWILDVDGEIEDILMEKYNMNSEDEYVEMMENSSVIEECNRMQIMYALDVKKIDKLGANWHNAVLDIDEYLRSKGFEYSRTMGFVNDRVLSDEELSEIVSEIFELGYGEEYFYKFDVSVIGNVYDFTSLLRDES